jgi:hypothetical protein
LWRDLVSDIGFVVGALVGVGTFPYALWRDLVSDNATGVIYGIRGYVSIRLVRQPYFVIWSWVGFQVAEPGAVVVPAGAGLVPASPPGPVQSVGNAVQGLVEQDV